MDKPIRRGGIVSSLKGDKIIIGFKYELLMGLCFHCGLFIHETKKYKKPRYPSQQELPYGEWLKARYRGREESTTKCGSSLRQTQRSVASSKKPNREGDPIQEEENINHPTNSTLNAKFSKNQNVANGRKIDSPGLNDTKALMSGLSGQKSQV